MVECSPTDAEVPDLIPGEYSFSVYTLSLPQFSIFFLFMAAFSMDVGFSLSLLCNFASITLIILISFSYSIFGKLVQS